jgi:hypothetical protein
MEELKIPVLPGRFCAIVKREMVTSEHIALHASGHPSGGSLKQYTDAVSRVLGDFESNNYYTITKQIMVYSKNPTHPIGVIENDELRTKLLLTFPGLVLDITNADFIIDVSGTYKPIQ